MGLMLFFSSQFISICVAMFVTYINHLNVLQIAAMVEFTSAFSISTVAAVVCNDAIYIGLLCYFMKTR